MNSISSAPRNSLRLRDGDRSEAARRQAGGAGAGARSRGALGTAARTHSTAPPPHISDRRCTDARPAAGAASRARKLRGATLHWRGPGGPAQDGDERGKGRSSRRGAAHAHRDRGPSGAFWSACLPSARSWSRARWILRGRLAPRTAAPGLTGPPAGRPADRARLASVRRRAGRPTTKRINEAARPRRTLRAPAVGSEARKSA